jgi:ATP-dependent RNA helicase SUPV3L1/SUV3
MDPDLVAAVESHHFDQVAAAEWRNTRLDFGSLHGLMRSLAEPPPMPGLKLSEEDLDETVLRQLAGDDEVARRCRDRSNLRRLWEVCQTPDFRKTTLEEHVRFARSVFEHLTERDRRLPADWLDSQYRGLDRLDGDIDALSARLASVRTLAYVANRSDWLVDPGHWQGRTRALEDRLSDTLHERLVQRFIDRRTSALMRGLHLNETLLAGVGADGAVTVEGHFVGRLEGARFDPARGSSALEDRALRAAAERAVGPEIARRLGRLASDPDEAFGILPDGAVLWRGELAGQLTGGGPFSPRVRLLGDLGPAPARERGARRLEAFVAAEASRRLCRLRALKAAVAEGRIKGLARGLAYRLTEAGGVIDRRAVEAEVRTLSQAERRALRALGVRFSAFSLYLPDLLAPEAQAFSRAFAGLAAPDWRPNAEAPSILPTPAPPATALAAWGLLTVAGLAVPVRQLEDLDALIRAAPRKAGGALLDDAALAGLGWTPAQTARILRGLGFTPVRKPVAGQPAIWRRRQPKPASGAPPQANAASPFAALAGLTPAQGARRPNRRRGARLRTS